MKNIKCLFGCHDFELEREYDEPAVLPEGWAGNAGLNHIKVYKCRRHNCGKRIQESYNWHEIRFCRACQKQGRQKNRIWSEDGGWDNWFGQGDGHVFWKCCYCGNIEPSIREMINSGHYNLTDWP